MKTTVPLLSISALAVSLLLVPPAFAGEEELTEAEAQRYARDLLKPEADRAGLDNIREEPSDRYLDEKEEGDLDNAPGVVREEE